jgi:hypothetical protein
VDITADTYSVSTTLSFFERRRRSSTLACRLAEYAAPSATLAAIFPTVWT